MNQTPPTESTTQTSTAGGPKGDPLSKQCVQQLRLALHKEIKKFETELLNQLQLYQTNEAKYQAFLEKHSEIPLFSVFGNSLNNMLKDIKYLSKMKEAELAAYTSFEETPVVPGLAFSPRTITPTRRQLYQDPGFDSASIASGAYYRGPGGGNGAAGFQSGVDAPQYSLQVHGRNLEKEDFLGLTPQTRTPERGFPSASGQPQQQDRQSESVKGGAFGQGQGLGSNQPQVGGYEGRGIEESQESFGNKWPDYSEQLPTGVQNEGVRHQSLQQRPFQGSQEGSSNHFSKKLPNNNRFDESPQKVVLARNRQENGPRESENGVRRLAYDRFDDKTDPTLANAVVKNFDNHPTFSEENSPADINSAPRGDQESDLRTQDQSNLNSTRFQVESTRTRQIGVNRQNGSSEDPHTTSKDDIYTYSQISKNYGISNFKNSFAKDDDSLNFNLVSDKNSRMRGSSSIRGSKMAPRTSQTTGVKNQVKEVEGGEGRGAGAKKVISELNSAKIVKKKPNGEEVEVEITVSKKKTKKTTNHPKPANTIENEPSSESLQLEVKNFEKNHAPKIGTKVVKKTTTTQKIEHFAPKKVESLQNQSKPTKLHIKKVTTKTTKTESINRKPRNPVYKEDLTHPGNSNVPSVHSSMISSVLKDPEGHQSNKPKSSQNQALQPYKRLQISSLHTQNTTIHDQNTVTGKSSIEESTVFERFPSKDTTKQQEITPEKEPSSQHESQNPYQIAHEEESESDDYMVYKEQSDSKLGSEGKGGIAMNQFKNPYHNKHSLPDMEAYGSIRGMEDRRTGSDQPLQPPGSGFDRPDRVFRRKEYEETTLMGNHRSKQLSDSGRVEDNLPGSSVLTGGVELPSSHHQHDSSRNRDFGDQGDQRQYITASRTNTTTVVTSPSGVFVGGFQGVVEVSESNPYLGSQSQLPTQQQSRLQSSIQNPTQTHHRTSYSSILNTQASDKEPKPKNNNQSESWRAQGMPVNPKEGSYSNIFYNSRSVDPRGFKSDQSEPMEILNISKANQVNMSQNKRGKQLRGRGEAASSPKMERVESVQFEEVQGSPRSMISREDYESVRAMESGRQTAPESRISSRHNNSSKKHNLSKTSLQTHVKSIDELSSEASKRLLKPKIPEKCLTIKLPYKKKLRLIDLSNVEIVNKRGKIELRETFHLQEIGITSNKFICYLRTSENKSDDIYKSQFNKPFFFFIDKHSLCYIDPTINRHINPVYFSESETKIVDAVIDRHEERLIILNETCNIYYKSIEGSYLAEDKSLQNVGQLYGKAICITDDGQFLLIGYESYFQNGEREDNLIVRRKSKSGLFEPFNAAFLNGVTG